MSTKIKTESYLDEKGAVLITALLILALLTIIGIGSVLMTNTEVKISGNLRASSLSLYVAEGGIEVAKNSINSSSSNNFSISPGTTNDTLTGFYYTAGCTTSMTYPCRTIAHPLNWFNTTWYQYNSVTSTCTSTVLSNTSDWPVCKNVTVGAENALVIVQRPSWSPAAPTKIAFKSITSEHTSSAPNKKISVTFEIDFGNNLFTFQEFRNNSNEMDILDNIDTPNNAILSSKSGYEWAMGGDPSGADANIDKITGIYTGNRKVKIEICIGPPVGCAWSALGIAQKNESNNTFILGSSDAVVGAGLECFYTASGYSSIGGTGLTLEGTSFRAVEIDPTDTCT